MNEKYLGERHYTSEFMSCVLVGTERRRNILELNSFET